MPRLSANGCEIYYEADGPEGADVLVLSNGILMSTASWALQVAALSRRYRLLRYDCRGQWQSEHPAGPYSLEQHADDLAALLDGLDIEKAHIGGISYGAEISMVFALRHPERARSLVLASAVSQVDPVLAGIARLWLAAAERRDPELLYQASYPFNFGEAWIAANGPALAAARTRYASLDFEAFAHLCRAFLGLCITDRLSAIGVPVLLMAGEEDILKPRRYADLIARALPQAEYVIVPRSGHALSWEQPQVFNSLVLGFLDRWSKGGN